MQYLQSDYSDFHTVMNVQIRVKFGRIWIEYLIACTSSVDRSLPWNDFVILLWCCKKQAVLNFIFVCIVDLMMREQFDLQLGSVWSVPVFSNLSTLSRLRPLQSFVFNSSLQYFEYEFVHLQLSVHFFWIRVNDCSDKILCVEINCCAVQLRASAGGCMGVPLPDLNFKNVCFI